MKNYLQQLLRSSIPVMLPIFAFFLFSCEEPIDPSYTLKEGDVQIVRGMPAQKDSIKSAGENDNYPYYIDVVSKIPLEKGELVLENEVVAGACDVKVSDIIHTKPIPLEKQKTTLTLHTGDPKDGLVALKLTAREVKTNAVIAEETFKLTVFENIPPVPDGELHILYTKAPKMGGIWWGDYMVEISGNITATDGDAAWGGEVKSVALRINKGGKIQQEIGEDFVYKTKLLSHPNNFLFEILATDNNAETGEKEVTPVLEEIF